LLGVFVSAIEGGAIGGMMKALAHTLYWLGHYTERCFGYFDWGGSLYQWLMRKADEVSPGTIWDQSDAPE
jgi:hypothetical protein